ncbi:MAG: hypothetical protein QXY40_02090 [Candidatus Methanomethylicia archaeon]
MVSTVIISLIAGWITAAFAMWMAARIVAGSKATFIGSLLIAVIGPILVFTSLILSTPLLGSLSILLALILWLWAVKSIFGVGWISAFAITILSTFTFLVAIIIVSIVLGISEFMLSILRRLIEGYPHIVRF